MTAKQAEVWALYSSGHRVTDIAHATGRSKGDVSSMLKRIKDRMHRPISQVEKSATCPHSSSCFTCPLSDCGISQHKAAFVNVIDGYS